MVILVCIKVKWCALNGLIHNFMNTTSILGIKRDHIRIMKVFFPMPTVIFTNHINFLFCCLCHNFSFFFKALLSSAWCRSNTCHVFKYFAKWLQKRNIQSINCFRCYNKLKLCDMISTFMVTIFICIFILLEMFRVFLMFDMKYMPR